MAIVAKTLKKPFYVAVESYKFARMYPLTQRDIRDMCLSATYDCNMGVHTEPSGESSPKIISHKSLDKSLDKTTHRRRSTSLAHTAHKTTFDHLNLTIDFTPAEYITLLFTDLGVLTPAAVSDELIRLYQ
jgi:translation initiation factor eIF-2B subunit alpha